MSIYKKYCRYRILSKLVCFIFIGFLQIVCSMKKKNTKQFVTIWIQHLLNSLDIRNNINTQQKLNLKNQQKFKVTHKTNHPKCESIQIDFTPFFLIPVYFLYNSPITQNYTQYSRIHKSFFLCI